MTSARGMLAVYGGTALAAALLAGAAPPTRTSAPRVTTAAVDFSSSADASKSVTSDKFRLVFLAGLEGSGHHYIMSADSAMLTENPHLPRISRPFYLTSQPYYVPSFMAGNASVYAEVEDQARKQMRRLATAAAGLPWPGSVYILHNSWSYPTFSGRDKVMQYIDLQRMAEMAEANGVDMRVIYLRRSAKDLLLANTVHRHFQK